MKAITLWQPWASLLACGAKGYETRSWATSYRGQIAIHAAKKDIYSIIKNLPLNMIFKAYQCLYEKFGIELSALERLQRSQGYIIATAELVGCWEIAEDQGGRPFICRPYFGNSTDKQGDELIVRGNELLFGDWTPGRYAWEFKNMQMLTKPIPAKGKQRLWNWEV